MAAADPWKIFDAFKNDILVKVHDLSVDDIKMSLHANAYVPSTDTDALFATATNELSGDGYAIQSLAGEAVSNPSAGVIRFDFTDQAFPQASADWAPNARNAVIHNDTPSSPLNPLIGFSLLDSAPADIDVNDGDTLTIQINASGMFEISGAA